MKTYSLSSISWNDFHFNESKYYIISCFFSVFFLDDSLFTSQVDFKMTSNKDATVAITAGPVKPYCFMLYDIIGVLHKSLSCFFGFFDFAIVPIRVEIGITLDSKFSHFTYGIKFRHCIVIQLIRPL